MTGNTGVRGQLNYHVPLKDYTSWRVGGIADQLYIPADSQDLVLFLQHCPQDMPLLWLGLGSNVLIRDGGVTGAVIVTQGALSAMTVTEESLVRAEAGVACAQIARFTARLGLTGLEFMAGIPGTVGGALAMNAGCYGGETWNQVYQVETIDRLGNRRIRAATEFEVGYRQVKKAENEWFLAGYFRLTPGEKNRSLNEIRVLLEKRNNAQPTGLPNCGSVFRNPPGGHAGRLIEQCGLKGMTIGGAQVSEKHANFIINEGNATALHIEELIAHIKAKVLEQHGVQLIQEVCIIGKAASR